MALALAASYTAQKDMATTAPHAQFSFPGLCPIRSAVDAMAKAPALERGAIFTKREVVDFILDLVGYRHDAPLLDKRLLEPSFGGGDFLFAAIDRLLASLTSFEDPRLDRAIRGVELHRATFEATKATLEAKLRVAGAPADRAASLVDTWLLTDDFLLTEFDDLFDVVVGNPPYVRQERIPDALIAEYRQRYTTVFDRADLYVPFIERSLSLLKEGGALGFICADRWMKNRYGAPLRQFVAHGYNLRAYVDMVDTPAFHSEVIAYPAIFVIGREQGSVTHVARRPQIDAAALSDLAQAMTPVAQPHADVTRLPALASGDAPWLLSGDVSLDLVRRLEDAFPTLAEAGCKVGIGVATGADRAFIGPLEALDVEDDRKLPLVMTRDIASGKIAWRGLGVINPFADEGGLVPLARYPRLARYLESHRQEIAGRHVAQKAPARWYRTIDRIYPELVATPKLLIPDIKGEAHIVYDEGHFYPHHNLYYITSDAWDLRALATVLKSGIGKLFVSAYSTTMRGGYFRYQAQYLRRIRLPQWHDVDVSLRRTLIEGSDADAVEAAVATLYGLSDLERTQLLRYHPV